MDQEPAIGAIMPPRAAGADVSERQQVYLAIVDEAARRMGADLAAVRGRCRARPVADARHAAFWALAQAGLRPATIARLFDLNHSTVVHGLARAERRPRWQAAVLPAVALAGHSGPEEALQVRLERCAAASGTRAGAGLSLVYAPGLGARAGPLLRAGPLAARAPRRVSPGGRGGAAVLRAGRAGRAHRHAGAAPGLHGCFVCATGGDGV